MHQRLLCSTNLQPPNYDAIKVLSRDTFVISIHQESYSINIPFLIYREMDTFIFKYTISIHKYSTLER